jgi:acyl-[acyl-carrier-protein]-phospholipid O-acyltransferase/long-chain-fatty-acid--[acyl-carrier-protein] ligase
MWFPILLSTLSKEWYRGKTCAGSRVRMNRTAEPPSRTPPERYTGTTMLKAVVSFILRLIFRVEVRGHYEQHDRTLVIANHQSFLDGILLGAFLPVDPWWIVHTQIAAQPMFKMLLKVVNHLTIDTGNPFALKQAMAFIESGKPVGIFPEGRITVTGRMMKVYEGPAFMAAKTGAWVIPVHIDGALNASWFSRMTGDFPQRWFPKITITIHPGQQIPYPEGVPAKERRRMVALKMQGLMQQMVVNDRKQQTVYEQFLDTVSWRGRKTQFVEDIRPAQDNFGTALKASLALGRLFSKITEPGEVVGVLLPNVGPGIYTLLGLWAFRRVPAMINYTAGLDGMQSALRSAKVKTVITSKSFLDKAPFGATVKRLEGVKITYLEDLRPMLTLGDKLWLILWAMRFPRSVIDPGEAQDPAVVLFTSGSEGKPKGVVLSHDAVLANCAQILSIFDITSRDKFLTSMPLFHAFGLTCGFVLPIVAGAKVFLYPTPLHYRVIPELAYDRDCTILFATNTFLANYAKRANPYDFRSVKLCISGAEKLQDEVRRLYADKFGLRIIEGYGATECAPVVAANNSFFNKPGTVGTLMPCMEYKLEPVPGIDGGGLLHVRGPNTMSGYWRESNPRVSEWPESPFGAGWYNTGDIVSIDTDGFIAIKGRVKRFAKVAGEMVSLEMVEKLAEHVSPKSVHASTTKPDAKRGEMILLVTQDRNLKREQLAQAARELGAPDFAVPRQIIQVDKIPLLGSGKKDYPAVKLLAEQRLQQGVQPASVEA